MRAACPASCPDPSAALLPVLPESDYITDPETYQLRLSQDICCLDYSTSYYMSGFSLLSRVHRVHLSVGDAIFSMVRAMRVRSPRGCCHLTIRCVTGHSERGDARAVRPDFIRHCNVAGGAPR